MALERTEIFTDENGVEFKRDFYTNGMIIEMPNVSEEAEAQAEPTQLDRIEAAVNKSHQDIIDSYTMELIEGEII